MPLKAVALNCTLKASQAPSSTELLLSQVLAALAEHGAVGKIIRVVDHDVKPGVTSDEGDGDAWPALRRKILDAHILVLRTPIWMGQPCSVCKRVLERMDAFLGETDDAGRMVSYGRVAGVHDPCQCGFLLDRRGHAEDRLQGPAEHAREGGFRDIHTGAQRRPPPLARGSALSQLKPVMFSVQKHSRVTNWHSGQA